LNVNRLLQAERERQAREAAIEGAVAAVTALPEADRRTALARLLLAEQDREPGATGAAPSRAVSAPAERRERRERSEPTIPNLVISALVTSDEPLTVQDIVARIHEGRPGVSRHSVKQAVVQLKAAGRLVQVGTGPHHGGIYAVRTNRGDDDTEAT
jgi:hypothetical protein